MSRTKRSTIKFKSRKQNNHRQKKTRHRKHRKHGKIGKRNKSKRKSRKIFFGGAPSPEQNAQHERRLKNFSDLLLHVKIKNISINNFIDGLPNNSYENIVYNLLKNFINNDIKLNEIKEYIDINNFQLYDTVNYLDSPYYINIIDILEEIIDTDKLSSNVTSPSNQYEQYFINESNIKNDMGRIRYISYYDNKYPIVTSFNSVMNNYYLTIDNNIFYRMLSESELVDSNKTMNTEKINRQARRQAEAAAAAAKAKGSARVAQLKRHNKLSRHDSP